MLTDKVNSRPLDGWSLGDDITQVEKEIEDMKKAFAALYSLQQQMKEQMDIQEGLMKSITEINSKKEKKTTKKTKKE